MSQGTKKTYFCHMLTSISSLQNPLIKQILVLQEKSRARKKEQAFIIEGLREIQLAIQGNIVIDKVLYCPSLCSLSDLQDLLGDRSFVEVNDAVYKKIAYRSSTEGVIAFAKAKKNVLSDLKLPKNPLILIAEAPEKPGNIGALLRTADAVGVDAFILANPRTDLYNPNIIRSSVGCVFTNQVATATTEEVIDFLQEKEVAIYSAILQEAVAYDTQDYTRASAIVVGTEATGLSNEWREASTQNISIPMQGVIDSMNVSVAAGILVFEARRQRGF